MAETVDNLFLVTPKGWGPISEEQMCELVDALAIFHCGKCSEEGRAVYHNTWGRHLHRRVKDLLAASLSNETNVGQQHFPARAIRPNPNGDEQNQACGPVQSGEA